MALKECVSIHKEGGSYARHHVPPCFGSLLRKSHGGQCRDHHPFLIVVPVHQGGPHVALSKLFQLAIRIIKFKALQLFGTKLFADTVKLNLMLEAADMLWRN